MIVGRLIPAGTGAQVHHVEPKLSIEMAELVKMEEDRKAATEAGGLFGD